MTYGQCTDRANTFFICILAGSYDFCRNVTAGVLPFFGSKNDSAPALLYSKYTARPLRFSNMFSFQVLSKGCSDEIKFGYLLEMVNTRVRETIANLKPGKIGLETAWERLNKEFGQKNAVINTHIDEIINLPTVRGTNYEKIQDFYNRLTKNCDALLTLGEKNMLKGFVMTTLR